MEHELYAEKRMLDLKIIGLLAEKEELKKLNPWYPTNTINNKIVWARRKRERIIQNLKTRYISPRYGNVYL